MKFELRRWWYRKKKLCNRILIFFLIHLVVHGSFSWFRTCINLLTISDNVTLQAHARTKAIRTHMAAMMTTYFYRHIKLLALQSKWREWIHRPWINICQLLEISPLNIFNKCLHFDGCLTEISNVTFSVFFFWLEPFQNFGIKHGMCLGQRFESIFMADSLALVLD